MTIRGTSTPGRAAALRWLAIALVVTPPATAQDVRVNQYWISDEAGYGAASNGTTIRFLLTGNWEFCGGSFMVLRQMNYRGSFLTGNQFAQETCYGGALEGSIAILPSGDLMVVRQLESSLDVYARCFDRNGAPLSPDIYVNSSTVGGAEFPSVLAHPSGFFVVGWDRVIPVTSMTVYARIVMPDGTLPYPAVRLPEATTRVQGPVRFAVFGSGEIVAVWGDHDGQPSPPVTIMERRFDASLQPLGPDTPVNQGLGVRTAGLDVAASGTEYVVTWDRGINGDWQVMARRLSQFSGPLGPEFIVNTYSTDAQFYPQCAFDAQGRAVIVWESYQQDGGSFGIFGQRLDASGNKWGPEFRVNMTTWNPQTMFGGLVVLPSGDFDVIFTTSTGLTLDSDALSRRFFFPASLAVGTGPGPMNMPRVATLRPDGRQGSGAWTPYAGAGGFGATVGTGDIDGGLDEVLTGPGPSAAYGPRVRAFRPDGTPLSKVDFFAYGTLAYGVNGGGADVDGDPYSEILATPGPGAVFGPHVRGFGFDNATLRPIAKVSFFAFGTLRYGAHASRGEVDGDGYDEVLATPGPSAVFGAQLRGFDYDNASVTSMPRINAYAFAGTPCGATVTSADIDSDGIGGYLDGWDEIVVGKGPSPLNDSEMRLFDYGDGGAFALSQRWAVSAPTPYASQYGIHVAGGDVDAGDTQEIATSPGPDPAATAHVLCWEWNPHIGHPAATASFQTIGTDDFTAYGGMTFGAQVAVGTFE